MGADEEGTHERLQAHRRELVDPKIGEHPGRIVNTIGDGILGGPPPEPANFRPSTGVNNDR